jgi:Family of unknown function (DUF6152)
MLRFSSRVAVGLGLALATARGFAHHSFAAEFDANKPMKLTGTVTKVEWTNPHAWFYLDVKDDNGKVANWGMELASPNALTRTGWSRSTMKVGDVVTVDGYAAKTAPNTGNARAITLTATGKTLLTSSSIGRGAQ